MPEDARYSKPDNPTMERRAEGKGAIFDVVEQLQPMARRKGCTLAQLALAWVAQQPGVTSPIIGPRTMEQLEDNLGALNVELNKEDLEFIDSICRPGDSVAPYYEADFGSAQAPRLGHSRPAKLR